MIGYCSSFKIAKCDDGTIISFYQPSTSGKSELFSRIFLSNDTYDKLVNQTNNSLQSTNDDIFDLFNQKATEEEKLNAKNLTLSALKAIIER